MSLYVHAVVASLKHGSRRQTLSPMHNICKLTFSAKAAAWLSPLHDEKRLHLQMNDWTLETQIYSPEAWLSKLLVHQRMLPPALPSQETPSC